MNIQSKLLRLVIATAACAALASGCGDDDGPTGSITPNHNHTTPDAGGADATEDTTPEQDSGDNDGGADPDGVSPDTEEPDGGDTPSEGPFCDAVDLGVLGPNASAQTTLDLADATNEVTLSCSQAAIAKEMMVRFSVEQTSRVKINATSNIQYGLNLQINRGACEAPDEGACFNSGAQNIIAEAGVEYFLTLESAVGNSSGEIELTLETEALECYPTQSSTCDGDEVQQCKAGFEIATHTCSLGCEIDSCAGDTCENAIPMDPSGTMRLEGSLAGYTSNFNMRGRPECFDSGFALPTDGPDILVALNGLRAGQTVYVDTSQDIGDPHDNAVFITKGCATSTPECVAGADDPNEKYEWVVTEDGDYTLIIDLIGRATSDFVYEVTID